jgi:hypothetical protein
VGRDQSGWILFRTLGLGWKKKMDCTGLAVVREWFVNLLSLCFFFWYAVYQIYPSSFYDSNGKSS